MPTLAPEQVDGLLRTGASTRVDAEVAPRFRPGDHVLVRNINPVTHTRLPRYVRGRRGVIERDHGVFVFADTNAHSKEQRPQHVYSVRFAARELWGEQAHARDTLNLDLWDDYLESAGGGQ
jgi:hypothetical protein